MHEAFGNKSKPGPKCRMDSFADTRLRNAIHAMFLKGMTVSVPKLQKYLVENECGIVKLCNSALRDNLNRLGFFHQKCCGKRFLGGMLKIYYN